MALRNTSRRWLAALVVLVAAGPLAAQARVRLSFADAVRRAAGEAPAVQLATLRTAEADARVREERGALLPSLAVGASWVNRDFNTKTLGIPFPLQFTSANPVPSFNNYDGRVAAKQTLFDWSRVTRVRAAGAQADGSRAEGGVTVEGAAQRAAVAYLLAARARSVVDARQADSSIAAELVTLAAAQRAAGVSAAIDVTRARTQLVTADGLLIVARNQLDRTRIDLSRSLGLDPAAPLELVDTLSAELGTAAVPAQRDSAVATALGNRPDLRAELARATAARQTGAAIKAERLPRLEVAADYGLNGLTVPSAIATRQVGLQVTVPILDGFRREARISEQAA